LNFILRHRGPVLRRKAHVFALSQENAAPAGYGVDLSGRGLPMTRVHLAVMLLAAVAATSAHAADAPNGERLARRWCATCHVVSGDQRQANVDAPAFAAIARHPSFTPERVVAFLFGSHPQMPNMALGRREAEDIAAYIASLR
jgi:mono/diheme cytochrome c family protein